MAKNIFVASTGPNTGKSVVCLGLINALRGMVASVGYFKPIGQKYIKNAKFDKESVMIKEIFGIEDELEYINPLSMKDVNYYISNNETDVLFQRIQDCCKRIEIGKDVVVIDGTDYLGMISAYEFDINADIANNLNASILLIEDGYNKSIDEIVSDIYTGKASFDEESCDFLGVIVNKVDPGDGSQIEVSLKGVLEKRGIDFFGAIPYDSVLPKPRIYDIAQSLDADILFGQDYLSNIAIEPLIASMTFENALKYIHDGSLIITGGDRNEILLGSIVSFLSTSYPNISGIILTGGLLPNKDIKDLIGSLSDLTFPILSVQSNTLSTANRIESLAVHVSSRDTQKIDAAKSLIYKYVNYEKINAKMKVDKIRKRTPDIFKYEIIERAHLKKMRIVLPEGDEERTLKAVERVRSINIADIILLGSPDIVWKRAKGLGINLDNGVEIVDPIKSQNFDNYVNSYLELRKHKHITLDVARDRIQEAIYYGTMMVYQGDADGLVSGAVHTTRNTIRPAFEIIKTRPDTLIASSIFFMCLKDRVLVYGDCAIVPDPNAEELADIAISSADTARMFNIEPLVAMLSYSTGESGTGPEVERVREAAAIAKKKRSDLRIEGPIQYDAAIDPGVAKTKLPNSEVAGRATVFIFPDLNTGNNTYKAVQRSAGAVAIGPVVQGLRRPVNDLSRGCLIEDIVYTIAITAIQAQNS
ncbi:MAG: phosphate acetyltransferase [Spirochaetota bacterium]|nr:phosphate acetyltransferase [Spirochaetota bacterium]